MPRNPERHLTEERENAEVHGIWLESWVPSPEHPFQLVIEDLGLCLEQQVCTLGRPLLLLFLDETPSGCLITA